MEQEIKNFDRNIERIVHEEETTPPFGVWNRISAELDALPAAETAPVKTFIPKRALTGIIAAALILAVSVSTDYVMNHVFTKDKTSAISAAQKTINPVTALTAAELPAKPANVATNETTDGPIATETKAKHHKTLAKAEKNTINNTAATSASSEPAINLGTVAPCTIKSVSSVSNNEMAQAYFFPPVDRSNSDKNMEKINYDKKIGSDDGDDSDKKIKSSEQKLKRPHKKRPSFNYGRFNRL